MNDFKVRGTFLLFSIGLYLFLVNFQCGIAAARPKVDLYAEGTYIEDIGFFDMVETNFDMMLGRFVREEKIIHYNSTNDTRTYYYYIIPAKGKDEETYFIALKVRESNSAFYDKVVKSTWDYLEGKTNILSYKVHTSRCITKMAPAQYKDFQEWFEEAEMFETKEELDKYVLPLYLTDETWAHSTELLLAGTICLLISLLIIILHIKAKWKQKKEAKQRLKERAEKQKYIEIDGRDYPKATFDHVNELCRRSKRQEAMQELCDITGIEKLDAKIIIDNWNEYYYV